MDGNVSRIQPVGSSLHSVEKSGGQGQRQKKDQPPFSLEEKDQEKKEAPPEPAGAVEEAPAPTPEEEIPSKPEGEAGGQLNVVA